ncbi:MAG: flagellar basal body P-ring formation chaperone FlgA [Synergistaceae bacterium]|jgi:flagella basal body P-ring formation protein FlgA|nr:flagellar basal body P-ring formation chaperone FlgA [Synergistaceae bacterium]
MKSTFRFFTFLAMVLTLISPAAAADLTVELPSVIEARVGSFYLGEYAELDGERAIADSASMAVISHNGSFSRDDVIEALAHTAAAGKSVSIRMSDVVRVLPEPSVASELRNMTAWKWRIDVDAIPDGWAELMKGYSGYSLPPKIIPGARTVAIKLEDKKGRQYSKQIKLAWYQPVVYSSVPVARGDFVEISSLGMRIDRAGMMVTNFSSPGQLANAEARKSISAGVPIETGDVTQESFVRAGSTVTMVANVNGLGIEAIGIAMQRGGLGDIIRVKNMSSKKVLNARITGPDRVEINP